MSITWYYALLVITVIIYIVLFVSLGLYVANKPEFYKNESVYLAFAILAIVFTFVTGIFYMITH